MNDLHATIAAQNKEIEVMDLEIQTLRKELRTVKRRNAELTEELHFLRTVYSDKNQAIDAILIPIPIS